MVVKNFEIFFHQISSFRYLLWFTWRHFDVSSKKSHQSMDSFQSIFAKYWGNYKIAKFATKIFFSRIFNLYHINFILNWKKFSILETSPMNCYSICTENVLEWIHALVAVFGTDIDVSPYESKQVPKWRYLMETF